MDVFQTLKQWLSNRRQVRHGALLALACAWGAGQAQAADVYWSIGVQSPGVVVGAANMPPVMYGPPVVVVPGPYYRVGPPPGHWRKHKHHRHEHRWHGDRYDNRYDRRHDDGRRYDDDGRHGWRR